MRPNQTDECKEIECKQFDMPLDSLWTHTLHLKRSGLTAYVCMLRHTQEVIGILYVDYSTIQHKKVNIVILATKENYLNQGVAHFMLRAIDTVFELMTDITLIISLVVDMQATYAIPERLLHLYRHCGFVPNASLSNQDATVMEKKIVAKPLF